MFAPAVRTQKKLRLGLAGPPGSGKSMTALRFAFAIGKKVAVIDTENKSASLYAGMSPDGTPFQFDTCSLQDYSPTSYTSAIKEAGRQAYDVCIIDGLTQAWTGEGGALEIKDKAAEKSRSGNSFFAWRDVTPMHNAMIEAILSSPCHIIATLRTKIEYIVEEEVRDGRKFQVPRQVGLKPIQREGMEYEFDIFGDLEQGTHLLKISKTRCDLIDGATCIKPGAAFLKPVIDWLNSAADSPAPIQNPQPSTNGSQQPIPPGLEKTIFESIYERVAGAKTVDQLVALGKEARENEKKMKPAEFETLKNFGKKRKEEIAASDPKSALAPATA